MALLWLNGQCLQYLAAAAIDSEYLGFRVCRKRYLHSIALGRYAGYGAFALQTDYCILAIMGSTGDFFTGFACNCRKDEYRPANQQKAKRDDNYLQRQ